MIPKCETENKFDVTHTYSYLIARRSPVINKKSCI